MIDVISLPVRVGDPVFGQEEFEALPAGATFYLASGVLPGVDGCGTLTKTTQGVFDTHGYNYRSSQDLTSRLLSSPWDFRLASIPGVEPPARTFDQYRFFWWDTVQFGSEYASGTGRREIERALTEFDISPVRLPFGTGQRIVSRNVRDLLPEGSTILVGRPSNWPGFGLFERGRARWNRLLGGGNDVPPDRCPVVVDRVSGERVEPDWLTASPTEEDAARIAVFKAKAWRLALVAKNRNGWCSTLENIMAQAGIDSSCLAHPAAHGVVNSAVGTPVTLDEMAALPIGTVLRWVHSGGGDRWAYYERVNNAGNTAGTRLLFGHREDGMPLRQYARNATIVGEVVGGRTEARVNFRDRGRYLPVGTLLLQSGSYFVKGPDGRYSRTSGGAAPREGTYNESAFGSDTDSALVVWFPGSPLTRPI